jgi:hypothetical protein
MYISAQQLERSLPILGDLHPFFGMSFLAFKLSSIPVGQTTDLNFSQAANEILDTHYRPSSTYEGYYNPFKTSRKAQRWLSPRYGSTSLQRITADTFSDVFIHPRNTKQWGWEVDYVNHLRKHLGGTLIPAFHLAVWLYRNENWISKRVKPSSVVNTLYSKYKLEKEEFTQLFDQTIPDDLEDWLSDTPVSEEELFQIIGYPPGSRPEEGAALRYLEVHEVGPATHFRYEPSDRLNIITGDNSLGKTFIFECAWWALTGQWLEMAVIPHKTVTKNTPKLSYQISARGTRAYSYSSSYDWPRQVWAEPSKREVLPGLVIYARFDGSIAVWDPARSLQEDAENRTRAQAHLFLSSKDIWAGQQKEATATRTTWTCNGLLRDWVYWQTSGQRYRDRFDSLAACLKTLSPSQSEPLLPGEPVRLPFDSQDIPTLTMPYGDVPVLHASAGIQRIIALSYIMVWAWHEHVMISDISRKHPQRRIVLLIDEVEAHLHPRWQRVIVPGIMEAMSQLASETTAQVHLATHSPMVMASAETIFDDEVDSLHHLRLIGNEVILEELPFIKRGTADLWLMSDVFQLGHARSLPAEQAINDAIKLQLADNVDNQKVDEVNKMLLANLAQDDEFWPRWRYFAKQHGVG